MTLSLNERMDFVERKVAALETLPDRVGALEVQVSALRDEMRTGFSALLGEIRVGDEGTRSELRAEIRAGDETTRSELRAEIRAGDERTRSELRAEIRAGDETTRSELRAEMRSLAETLRQEIRSGDEETRTLMRVLHEDVIGRLALLQEGRTRRKRPSKN